jgi:hypothetical protein
MWRKVGFASWNLLFFATGAVGPSEGGEVRERALGSPTHPLAHRGAWRHRQGGKGELCTALTLFVPDLLSHHR